MSNFYEKLCQTFIRPTRQTYNSYDLGLPIRENGRRIDFQLYNNRQNKLLASFYSNNHNPLASCVVYLHSLNGSRLQSLPFVDQVLARGFNFCSFDFSGTGLSQGQYVSLGFYEKYDIKVVLDYLSSKFNIKSIYLWGRSMGAAATIKFMSMINNPKKSNKTELDYKIDGLILDSPFQSLTQMTIQIAKQKIHMPQLFIKAVLMMIQSSIQDKAGFKISDMELLPDTKYLKCPVLLLTSKDDKLVLSNHSQKIYDAIPHKDRQIMFIRGEHNSSRDIQTITYIIEFVIKDFEKRKVRLNGKQSFVKSSKILNYKMNNLASSVAFCSKSFKKLNNISLQGPRFETAGDQDLTCCRLDDEVQQEQKIRELKEKEYKKAIHLYSPKIGNKLIIKNEGNFAKKQNSQQPDILKISTQNTLNKIQNNFKFDLNFHQNSQKKVYNEKGHIEVNKSPIKEPPNLHEASRRENQNHSPIVFVTPEKRHTQNERSRNFSKQSLLQSEQREPRKLELKKQATEESKSKIYSHIEVNHFNIINQKLRKKKRKVQPSEISPKPHTSQDHRILTVSVQRKSQLIAKPHLQLLKIKLPQQNYWRNNNY